VQSAARSRGAAGASAGLAEGAVKRDQIRREQAAKNVGGDGAVKSSRTSHKVKITAAARRQAARMSERKTEEANRDIGHLAGMATIKLTKAQRKQGMTEEDVRRSLFKPVKTYIDPATLRKMISTEDGGNKLVPYGRTGVRKPGTAKERRKEQRRAQAPLPSQRQPKKQQQRLCPYCKKEECRAWEPVRCPECGLSAIVNCPPTQRYTGSMSCYRRGCRYGHETGYIYQWHPKLRVEESPIRPPTPIAQEEEWLGEPLPQRAPRERRGKSTRTPILPGKPDQEERSTPKPAEVPPPPSLAGTSCSMRSAASSRTLRRRRQRKQAREIRRTRSEGNISSLNPTVNAGIPTDASVMQGPSGLSEEREGPKPNTRSIGVGTECLTAEVGTCTHEDKTTRSKPRWIIPEAVDESPLTTIFEDEEDATREANEAADSMIVAFEGWINDLPDEPEDTPPSNPQTTPNPGQETGPKGSDPTSNVRQEERVVEEVEEAREEHPVRIPVAMTPFNPPGMLERRRMRNNLVVEDEELLFFLKGKAFAAPRTGHMQKNLSRYAYDWLKQNRPGLTQEDMFKRMATAVAGAMIPDTSEEHMRQFMKQGDNLEAMHKASLASRGNLGRKWGWFGRKTMRLDPVDLDSH